MLVRYQTALRPDTTPSMTDPAEASLPGEGAIIPVLNGSGKHQSNRSTPKELQDFFQFEPQLMNQLPALLSILADRRAGQLLACAAYGKSLIIK